MGIDLRGRTAIVTGVSSGLGEGVARVFASAGAHVIGVARRADRGEAVRTEICAAGGAMTFIAGDITEEKTRARAVEAAIAVNGQIDILINNAGASGEVAPIDRYDENVWDGVVATNLTAVFRLSRLVMPHMRRQHDGVILNIASINAVIGVTGMSAYCAAKAGVVHLTKVMAAEGAPDNVRANAIILGGVASEMGEATVIALAKASRGEGAQPSAAALEAYRAQMMEPRDVAASLAVLCLPEAALITGSEIAIDRGFSAGAGASALIHAGAASLVG